MLFFTDPVRTPYPERAVSKLPRGAAIVYRAFGAATALSVGQRLSVLSRRRGVLFFVGASPALAVALRADGLHLPERHSGRAGDIRRLARRFIVTAAAHDFPSALRAQRSGAQAVVISPVFPSASPSAGAPLGPRRISRMARALDTPVIALGGVDANTIKTLARTGVVGIAAIAGIIAKT